MGERAQQRAVAATYVEHPTRRPDSTNLQELLKDDVAASAWSALSGESHYCLFDATSLVVRLILTVNRRHLGLPISVGRFLHSPTGTTNGDTPAGWECAAIGSHTRQRTKPGNLLQAARTAR